MAQPVVRPDWTATSDETAQALAAWARERGLAYEVTGLLPPASLWLVNGFGMPKRDAVAVGGEGAKGGFLRVSVSRPGRFSENVCSGPLPGGIVGTLAHHSYVEDRSTAEDREVVALGFTTVVAEVPESLRVTRHLVGVEPRDKPKIDIDLEGDAPYGPLTQSPDLTPSLRDRFTWEMLIREEPGDVTRAFTPALVDALAAAPEGTKVTVQGGWVVAELWDYRTGPAQLDGLCRTASAVADAMRRAAAMQLELEPGTGLRDQRPTQITRWLDEMVAQIDWPEPPNDVAAAAEAYGDVAEESKYAKQRRFRHGRAMFVGIFIFFVIPWFVIGYVVEGVIVGAVAGAAALALAIGMAMAIGGQAQKKVASHHAHTWGLEAFARGYARSRGLWLEDDQEFRRRFRSPLHGGPQFSMRGQLADGVEGRLVLWRDGSDPEKLQRIWNLALVPAPAEDPETPGEGLHLWRAGDWLVVGEPSDDASRSLAALDSLRRRAAALAAR